MSFSVVMPTMWRSDRTKCLLDSLNNTDCVSEIIVIDNDKGARPDFQLPDKVVLLEQEENIFVNPAWNLGVKESKEKYLCIINDDVTIPCEKVFPIVLNVLEKVPCIGIHPSSYEHEGDDIFLEFGHAIGRGWGCCLFLDKRKWVDIPEQLKIWFGDNWIVNIYKECASILIPIKTKMSTTSNSEELSDVIKKDIEEWKSQI